MTPAPDRGLARRLNLLDAVSLVVGGVIGSAIFLVPSTVLAANPAPMAAALVFAFAGILSWFGALAYAELGSLFPETGGEYVYLRESWGSLAAFLCGWTYFFITQTGGLATIAAGFSLLLGSIVPLTPVTAKACSAALIIVLTAVNYAGVKVGARVNNLFTVFKVSGLAVMIVAILARPDPSPIRWEWPLGWTPIQFAAALVPVLWAYEGWNMTTFVGGEIEDAPKNLPRALAGGLAIVFFVYVVSLWVFLRALPVPQIIGSSAVAGDAAIAVLGPWGGRLVAFTMLAALVGAANVCVLAPPRVYLAMALDGLFFRSLARVHTAYRTPSNALLLQCAWALILALSGSYDVLLSYTIFGAWIFYFLAVAGVIRLRRLSPHLPRPCRMWGFPFTAVCFLLVAAAFVLSTFITAPWTSLAGVGLIATGIPFYFHWRGRAREGNAQPGALTQPSDSR
jgi:APA family basic amino acid/polyamine antiporter